MNIELLKSKATNADISAKLNELITAYNETASKRDRGPKSDKAVTLEIATKIMADERKEMSHKEVAKELQLSYGQVYSVRKGFTFKQLHRDLEKVTKKA